MEWHATVGVISGILQVGSIIPYVRDILKGTTRPNAVSTGLWMLLAGIAFVAQISAGASWSVILVGGIAFNCTVVTVLALSGYGYAKYGKLDWLCLALGLTSIGAWILTENPVVAIILAVIASIIANIPTVVKTYREPHSEHAFSWLVVVTASSLSLLSTAQWNIQNLLYPFEDWILNLTIFSLAFWGQRKNRGR